MELFLHSWCRETLIFLLTISIRLSEQERRFGPGGRPAISFGGGFFSNKPLNANQFGRPLSNIFASLGFFNSFTSNRPSSNQNGGLNFPKTGFHPNAGSNIQNKDPCSDNNPFTVCISNVANQATNPCNDNNPATICISDVTNNNNRPVDYNPCTDDNPLTVCITDVTNNQPYDPCNDNNPTTICISNFVRGSSIRKGK